MPQIVYEYKAADSDAVTKAFQRFDSSDEFRVSMEAFEVMPRIEHGHWTAEYRRHGRSEAGKQLWTMRARYDGDTVDLRFFAHAHPENKYPPSEAVPSPVTLAGFLEYCQALAAKDTK
jgi:hypothetical protein